MFSQPGHALRDNLPLSSQCTSRQSSRSAIDPKIYRYNGFRQGSLVKLILSLVPKIEQKEKHIAAAGGCGNPSKIYLPANCVFEFPRNILFVEFWNNSQMICICIGICNQLQILISILQIDHIFPWSPSI